MSPVLRSTSAPMDAKKTKQNAQGRNPGAEGSEAGPRTPFQANRPVESPELQDGWNFRLLV